MLDESNVSRDNVLEPIENQQGKHFRINKDELPEGRKPCDEHVWEIDKSETHEAMQGYVCQNCKFGKLVRSG